MKDKTTHLYVDSHERKLILHIPLFQKQGDFLYPKSRKDGLTVYENKV